LRPLLGLRRLREPSQGLVLLAHPQGASAVARLHEESPFRQNPQPKWAPSTPSLKGGASPAEFSLGGVVEHGQDVPGQAGIFAWMAVTLSTVGCVWLSEKMNMAFRSARAQAMSQSMLAKASAGRSDLDDLAAKLAFARPDRFGHERRLLEVQEHAVLEHRTPVAGPISCAAKAISIAPHYPIRCFCGRRHVPLYLALRGPMTSPKKSRISSGARIM